MNRKSVLIIVLIIILASVAGYFVFIQYHREKVISEQTLAAYNSELAACGAYPNNSTQSVIETGREAINLPKDIYSPPDNQLTFTTASGTATAGWISNAGAAGESYGATATCWSYYYKFDGEGTVDLTATSAIKGMPDYLVHFVVAPVYAGQSITYTNSQYGFTFTLPASWQGYSIATTTWTGWANCPSGDCTTGTGMQILIRNPQWTSENNWAPIPIMVFTLDQWNALLQGKLLVSAAPFPPSELGHNANYVFALPARYDAAETEGWQEVEAIMASNPLHGE